MRLKAIAFVAALFISLLVGARAMALDIVALKPRVPGGIVAIDPSILDTAVNIKRNPFRECAVEEAVSMDPGYEVFIKCTLDYDVGVDDVLLFYSMGTDKSFRTIPLDTVEVQSNVLDLAFELNEKEISSNEIVDVAVVYERVATTGTSYLHFSDMISICFDEGKLLPTCEPAVEPVDITPSQVPSDDSASDVSEVGGGESGQTVFPEVEAGFSSSHCSLVPNSIAGSTGLFPLFMLITMTPVVISRVRHRK